MISDNTSIACESFFGFEISSLSSVLVVQGMASHLQVLALSDWLAVSLPTDYSETVRGLRWLIPHVKTPWQHSWTSKSDSVFGNNIVSNLPIVVQFFRHGGRQLLMQESVLTMEDSVEDKPAEDHFILSCRHQRRKVRKLYGDVNNESA